MTNPITFGSVCSGIEAASVAWHPLGWRAAWLAEIEPFPCAVLTHHYPDVPNLGDMTKIAALVRDGFVPAPDVFCGGTPCQAFSVAGLRNSLDDARGNLSLTFCEIANEIDARRAAAGLLPSVVFWENVPGVLSTKDNAFGCFLAGLAGEDDPLVAPGGKWANAGCVFGPSRVVAWRTLDAQFFGVAQRRRRVFVVASAREGFDPCAILFEPESLHRNSPPRRQAGQEVAGTISARTSGGGGLGTDFELGGGFSQLGRQWPAEVAPTLNAAFGQKLGLENQHIRGGAGLFVPAAMPTIGGVFNSEVQSVALRGRDGGATAELGGDVAGTLRASGGGGDKAHVLAPLAFDCKASGMSGFGVGEIASTMRAMGHAGSRQNGGGHLAVCVTGEITRTLKAEGFDASEDGTGRGQPIVATAFKAGQSEAAGGFFATVEYSPTLQAQNNGSTAVPTVHYGMAVRRLTPRECARLQGFPDDHLSQVIVRGKPAADGPMYKALGNSWAVPNVRWLGRRIDAQLRASAP